MLKKPLSGNNLHEKYHAVLLNILESISLPVFLIYIQFIEKNSSQDWLGPYLLSSTIGLIATAILFFLKRPLNRIFIGIHLYFFSGLIGVAGSVVWLNELYGALAAAGMLAWIALACAGSIAFSGGLYGKEQQRLYNIKTPKSGWLNIGFIGLAVLCAGFSWLLQGNRFLSEFAPFITLFTAYSLLKAAG